MQDVQNIPNPDVDSIIRDDDFGNHSDVNHDSENSDVEQPSEDSPNDRTPNAPIEEPPAEDGMEEQKRIA
jgi:hypothetical protein